MITFNSMQEIISAANVAGTTISRVTLLQSVIDMEKSEDEIKAIILDEYLVMKASIKAGLDKNLRSTSGLSGGMAAKMESFVRSGSNISGNFLGEVIYNALAVIEYNACMGKVVSCPTAGSCGILPACMVALQNKYKFSDDEIVMGLITASAVGMVIAKCASISGAASGCQAECGSAAAMAAAAMVELLGGSPDACGHAAAQVIKSVLGLVCDPVAGLVEEPCVIRNATIASIAVTAAEMSLAGIESIIPVDEVIDTMKHIGETIPPSLRETSEGGLARTKTGLEINTKLQSKEETPNGNIKKD